MSENILSIVEQENIVSIVEQEKPKPKFYTEKNKEYMQKYRENTDHIQRHRNNRFISTTLGLRKRQSNLES